VTRACIIARRSSGCCRNARRYAQEARA
jgi:hypothetical protein